MINLGYKLFSKCKELDNLNRDKNDMCILECEGPQ
jgi:hypothetical protein